MTVEEAINAIKDNYPTSGYYMLREALDMAISALKKQMPMKTKCSFEVIPNGIDTSDPVFISKFCCGSCSNVIAVGELELSDLSDDIKYCENCGQKIDWGDIDDD